MRRGAEGSILVHVLITSVLMSIVAAGLISVMLLQYHETQRVEQGAIAKRADEEILHSLVSNWNNTAGGKDQTCTDFTLYSNGTPITYSCSGTAGACSCSCTSAGLPTISAATSGSQCKITIVSADIR